MNTYKAIPSSAFWDALGFFGGWFVIGGWLVGWVFYFQSLTELQNSVFIFYLFEFLWEPPLLEIPKVLHLMFDPGDSQESQGFTGTSPQQDQPSNTSEKCQGFQSLFLTNEHQKWKQQNHSATLCSSVSRSVRKTCLLTQIISLCPPGMLSVRISCILNYFNLCIGKLLLLLNELL